MNAMEPEQSADEESGRTLAAEMQDLLLGTDDVQSFVQQLVEMAAGTIGHDLSVGLTVEREGRPTTVASSDEVAARYDEVQYGDDEGPCLTALRTGQYFLVDDLANDHRLPKYRAHALPLGLRSSLSLPIEAGEGLVAAMNMYSPHPHVFGPEEQREARRFVGEASRALALAVRLARQTEMTEQLRTALTSRSVIDQAIGIVMSQNRCGPDEAFGVLRSASQHRNVKLRIVAETLVSSVADRAAGPGSPG